MSDAQFFVIIRDDVEHDMKAAFRCFKSSIEDIKRKIPAIECVHMGGFGTASQFKNNLFGLFPNIMAHM